MKQLLPLAISLALAAGPALAITDEEGNASLQFNFSAPGARSLAMGGAFIGLADDATAAFSNPAGLLQLAAPEVSAEVRGNDFTTHFVDGGNFDISPFDLSGLNRGQADSETRGLSFLSFVLPSDRYAIALYRHEFLNYETEFSSAGAIGHLGQDELPIFPFDASIDAQIVSYGLSGAFRVSDQFSLGLSLNAYQFDLQSSTRRFTTVGNSTVRFLTQQDGDDGAFGFSLGGQYRINDQWQAGLVYRRAPEFKYTASVRPGNDPNVPAASLDKTAYFNAPDLLGVGLVFRPSEALTLALDVSHINYSELTDDMQSNFRLDDSLETTRVAIDPLKIDDGVEIRAGAEYTFTEMSVPLSLRIGFWRDPDHAIRFEGAPVVDASTDAIANAALFSNGDDETHVSLGFGLAFEKFQLDAGFDASDSAETVSMSGVVRF